MPLCAALVGVYDDVDSLLGVGVGKNVQNLISKLATNGRPTAGQFVINRYTMGHTISVAALPRPIRRHFCAQITCNKVRLGITGMEMKLNDIIKLSTTVYSPLCII